MRKILSRHSTKSGEEFINLDCTPAKIFGVQGNGVPLRTALHHEFAIVFEFDREEDVFAVVKIVNGSAVEIDIDFFNSISENETGDMVCPEGLLPVGQAFDIVGCYPAFEAGKFLEACAFETSALDFSDDDGFAGWVEQVVETFYFGAAQRRPLLLVDGNKVNVIIYQPVCECPFVVVEMKIFHYVLRGNPPEKFVDINVLLLTGSHILNDKLVFLGKFLADDYAVCGLLCRGLF